MLGLNDGQLGSFDVKSPFSTTPVDVCADSGHCLPLHGPFLSGVSSVTAGDGHTCVTTTTSGAKCWGRNEQGQVVSGRVTIRGKAMKLRADEDDHVVPVSGSLARRLAEECEMKLPGVPIIQTTHHTAEMLRDDLKAAGIPHAGRDFHELRHTTSTWLRSLGVEPLFIMSITGHKDMQSMLGYAHPLIEQAEKAMASMPDLGATDTGSA